MMRSWAVRFITVIPLLAVSVATASEVDVLQWNLSTTVTDDVPAIPLIETIRSQTVENPFLQMQHVSPVPHLSASAAYDVSWGNDSGSFHVAIDQDIQGRDRAAATNGRFRFATAIDLIFTGSGSMTFASSPGDEADFWYGIGLHDINVPLAIYSEHEEGGDLHFETPASGSLSFASGDILLPAGLIYEVTLTMSSRTYTHPDQDPISASGELNFSWRPVPEPASVLLLAFASVGALRHRRHAIPLLMQSK